MSKVALLLTALLAIVLLIGYMMKTDSKLLLIELIMYISLLIIIRFYLPDIEMKRSWNTMTRTTNGNDPVRDICFTSSTIIVRPQQGTESTYQYMEIASIRTTEHLIIMSLANKSEILLDKEGFTTGSFDEISHFFTCS